MSQALEAIRAARQSQDVIAAPTAQSPVDSQLGRTFAQGATFGFADEIEAAVRAVVPESMGGGKYTEVRDELRRKLSDYAEQNPGAALSAELAGAFLPSIVMAFAPVPGARVAAGQNLRSIATRSAGEALVSAVGYSEADEFAEGAAEVGVGTGVGTALGVGTEVALGQFGKLGSKLINFVRKNMGGADTAVQAELRRLAEGTGKSIDEIIADVAAGRVMADNKTLGLAIKSMVQEGGLTKAEIIAASSARRKSTGNEATESLRGALAPDAGDPNVLRARRLQEADIKKEQSGAYDEVFASSPSVSPEVEDQMLNIIQSVPTAKLKLDELYRIRNLVPLFKEDPNGAIVFVRKPNLEDAEILRRNIGEEASARFRAGEGSVGEALSGTEAPLRQAINLESPDLAAVRQKYSQMMDANKAFDEGRQKALTMNVDELEMVMESLKGEALSAFRAGSMDALRNRARRSGVLLRDLAKEDVQVGAALRVLLPEGQAPDVLARVGRAAEASEMDKFIQPTSGSPTAGLIREQELRGSGNSAEDMLRATQGDPMAIIKLVSSSIPSAKGLSQQQMAEVGRILYSENPELVAQALTDKTVLAKLVKRAETLAAGFTRGAGVAGAQQGAQFGQERL
tara:strand:- start:2319 stop:4202 length:1884 start_codon:yes stop_codon:yes gene_type:complete